MKRTYLATSVILVGAMIVCAGCENAPAASNDTKPGEQHRGDANPVNHVNENWRNHSVE